MILKNKILKNKYITIKPFSEKYINTRFVRCLNNKNINKYLTIRREKQTIDKAKKYYEDIKKHNDCYFAIFSNKDNLLIGTIVLQKYKKNKFYKIKYIRNSFTIGFMICYKKYFGTKESQSSFKLFLDYIFKNPKINYLNAGTEKDNISSNFNLINNGFKLVTKTNKLFIFLLERKEFLKR